MPKARKMVSLNIEEASGVDHPAHLHEGWLVIKSDNLTSVDDLLSDLKQETKQSDASLYQKGTEEEPMAQDELKDIADKAVHMPDEEKEKGVHDTEDKEKMSYGDMEKKIKALEEELEMAKKKMKKMEDGTKAVHDDEMEKAADLATLVKSAPEPLRKMLEDLEKSADEAKARATTAEEILKSERIARANDEAIEKAKAWTYLGLEADKVGPALRQLADVDAELAKSVEEALNSVNAQAESANIFAEIGKSASPKSGNAYDQLTSLAKSVTESKNGVTFEQAFSEAALSNPDLYKQYLNEKGA